jgi:hypothetical protein
MHAPLRTNSSTSRAIEIPGAPFEYLNCYRQAWVGDPSTCTVETPLSSSKSLRGIGTNGFVAITGESSNVFLRLSHRVPLSSSISLRGLLMVSELLPAGLALLV